MKITKAFIPLLIIGISVDLSAQKADPFKPDNSSHAVLTGMTMVWNDEFNSDGKPDPSDLRYETGSVRNRELQWYQQDNANCKGGVLLIEGRREKIRNPGFTEGSQNWQSSISNKI